jgi:predicted RNase H-like HicB family nuclease
MRPFIAFIRKQPSAGFRVSFPDLPECCISTGSTIAEARDNAESALAFHCQLLQDLGAPLPPPSYLHQIAWSRERTDGLVVLIAPPRTAS